MVSEPGVGRAPRRSCSQPPHVKSAETEAPRGPGLTREHPDKLNKSPSGWGSAFRMPGV